MGSDGDEFSGKLSATWPDADAPSPLVLVADDDASTRQLIGDVLAQTGFTLAAAENGVEAIEAFHRLRPDIVLLDVLMPKMDGITACRQLRSHPTGKHVPVLMVTAIEDIESIRSGYEAGATDFVLKPIKRATLGYHVRYMLRAARAMVELDKSNKVKDEFLAVMSHELRTPLSIIAGYAGLLKQDNLAEQNPTCRKALDAIAQQSDALLGLINTILETTMIESGASTMQVAEISLVELFDKLKAHCVAPANKNIAIGWNYSPDLPPMRTDGEKLRLIIRNLVDNAVKFTEQGRVVVEASYSPGRERLEIHIRDSGVGIAKELLPVIFDKFRQLDGSATRGYGGVGLGLHIVKVFTEMLGGTIEVESCPGKGSTFSLYFPLTAKGAAMPSAADSASR